MTDDTDIRFLSVRLSVCLPVTFWYCVYIKAKYIVKLYPPSGKAVIPIFSPIGAALQNSDVNTLNRGVKY